MPERILVIDDDTDTLQLVGLMLQRQGYLVVSAANGAQGLARALEHRPSLILLDVMMPDMDGYEVTRRLRANPVTAPIPILMFTAKTQLDDKVTGFESGADDYLTKPTHPTELLAHVSALLTRSTMKKVSLTDSSLEKPGYVIGVMGARGGLGVSTVGMNISAALYTLVKTNVILAELTPGQGTIGMELGLSSPTRGLSSVLKRAPADVTRKNVQAALETHKIGVKVLAASFNPRDVDLTLQVEKFRLLVSHLAALGRFVVLDLGSGLPSFVQSILPICSELLIVMEGTPYSTRQTKMLLGELNNFQHNPKALSVILNNRQRMEGVMSLADAQTELGTPISASLTPAPEVFLQAIRLQTPPVITQPSHPVSQQFLKLADAIIERERT